MRKIAALAGVAALGLGAQANAYDAIADVTFSWAGNGIDKGWTSSGGGGQIAATLANSTFFSDGTDNNSTTYYNSDFADNAFFATTGCATGPTFRAQYACKIQPPPTDVSPITGVGPGASASGQITVTDTTLTGTLTLLSTTDVGAGQQLGTVAATGYNIRSADGSPFKNVWYGTDAGATIQLNLTGTFTATDWDITGGTARFNDPNFQCAFADFTGVLCNPSTVTGAFDSSGSNQSWGADLDGGGTGTTMVEIEVRDGVGGNIIESISGVLANLSVDGAGNIGTDKGEIRRMLGSSGGGCPTYIVYDATTDPLNPRISCGTLTASELSVTGSIVPVPAAVWLFGSALGLLGWIRRRV